MAGSPSLLIERSPLQGGTLVVLRGEIDDTLDATALSSGLSGAVVFDLDQVRRITSYGVREWMRALKLVNADYVGFIHVRPSMVSQFNMVAGFSGAGEVLTLYLPYICEWCDSEEERLLDLTKDHAVALALDPPTMACSLCKADMEFDDIPQSYFAFVASRPAPNPPLAVRRYTDPAAVDVSEVDAPLKVQKEIAGHLTAIWLSGRLDKQFRVRRLIDGLEGNVVVACRGMASFDDVGKERFFELLQAKGCEIFVARLPVKLAAALGQDVEKLGTTLASVDVPVSCAGCGFAGPAEVDALGFAIFVDEDRTIPCPRCQKAAAAEIRASSVAHLAGIFSTTLPPDLSEYLAERTGTFIPDGASLEGMPIDESGAHGAAPAPAVAAVPQAALSTYEIVRSIGQGGMAEVFLAEQRGMKGFHKRVVLKKILPTLRTHRVFLEMFFQEARVAAQVSHQNVVQIFDLGIDQDVPFIVMEYVRGWDLRSVISGCRRTEQVMPVEFACRIVSDIAAGLHAAHSAVDGAGRSLGIVHRDVSPHNVLISVEGAVKITDFGVSKAEASSLETKPGQIKGKLVYMAPEQIDETLGVVDRRSDVFAAGIVLYECLTGISMFKRDNEFKTMNAVLNLEIPDVQKARPDVPADVAEALSLALQRKQANRLPSALDLQMRLEEALVRISRPATAAHFASWLRDLQMRVSQLDEVSAPMLTPTQKTPSVTASMTLDHDDNDSLRSETRVLNPAKK
jgi:serine/threonine protein kinase